MTPASLLAAAMRRLPLVAILRGLTPSEAPGIGSALTAAGFGMLEVPLNSPAPFESIGLLATAHPEALVGAGTVLSAAQVRQVHAAGGRLIVSPNFDADVVRQAVQLEMVCLPGILTPTEAFAALAAGAHALKLFPSEMASPGVVRAMLAVLPAGTALLPVGGVTVDNMGTWRAAGAAGCGIGSALYKPGKLAQVVQHDAAQFAAAWQQTLST